MKKIRVFQSPETLEMRYWVVFLVALVCGISSSARSASNDPIELMYHERAPYYISQGNGLVTGLVGDPVVRAFEGAGVNFEWAFVAANRHLEIVKANKTRVCAVGWFKNSEREKFAIYTAHVYQDKPMVAIVRTDNQAAQRHRMVEQLLADVSLKMGRKLGYSYGGFIDEMAKTRNTRTITSSQSNSGLIQMLIAKRFDFSFFPGDEVESIFTEVGESARRLSVVSLENMPEGNKRYLLCSHRVDDEIIRRLNAVIETGRP